MNPSDPPATIQDLRNSEAVFAQMIQQLAIIQLHTREDLEQLTGTVQQIAVKMDQLTVTVDKLSSKVDRLAEMQAHTDERLNTLLAVVDGLIRHNPPPLQ